MKGFESDLPLLVEVIKCQLEDPSVVKQSLLTIAAICNNHAEARDVVRESGCLFFLCELLAECGHVQVRNATMYCLGCAIENNTFSQKEFSTPAMFTLLESLLAENREDLQALRSCTFLLMLAVANNGHGQTLLKKSNCLQRILTLFQTSMPAAMLEGAHVSAVQQSCQDVDLWTTVTSVLSVAVNNPQNDENQRSCTLVFPHALRYLQECKDPAVTRSIAAFLGVAIANNFQNQESLKTCRGLEALCSALHRSVNRAAQSPAHLAAALALVGALDAAVTEHNTNCTTCGRLGGISLMLQLLHVTQSVDTATVVQIILTLGHCVDNCVANQVLLVEQGGMSALLQQLASSTDEELTKAVRYVLQSCVNIDTSVLKQKNSLDKDLLESELCLLKRVVQSENTPPNEHQSWNKSISEKLLELEDRLNQAEHKYTQRSVTPKAQTIRGCLLTEKPQKHGISHQEHAPEVLHDSTPPESDDTRSMQNHMNMSSQNNPPNQYAPQSTDAADLIQSYVQLTNVNQINLENDVPSCQEEIGNRNEQIRPNVLEAQQGLSLEAIHELNSAPGNIYTSQSQAKMFSLSNVNSSLTSSKRRCPETSTLAKQMIIDRSVITKQGDKLRLDVSQIFPNDSGFQDTANGEIPRTAEKNARNAAGDNDQVRAAPESNAVGIDIQKRGKANETTTLNNTDTLNEEIKKQLDRLEKKLDKTNEEEIKKTECASTELQKLREQLNEERTRRKCLEKEAHEAREALSQRRAQEEDAAQRARRLAEELERQQEQQAQVDAALQQQLEESQRELEALSKAKAEKENELAEIEDKLAELRETTSNFLLSPVHSATLSARTPTSDRSNSKTQTPQSRSEETSSRAKIPPLDTENTEPNHPHHRRPVQPEHLHVYTKDGDFIKPLQPTMRKNNIKVTPSRSAPIAGTLKDELQAREAVLLEGKSCSDTFSEMEADIIAQSLVSELGYDQDEMACPPSPVASHFDIQLLQNSITSDNITKEGQSKFKSEKSKIVGRYDENMNEVDESWKERVVMRDTASTISPGSSVNYDFKALGVEIIDGYVRAAHVSTQGSDTAGEEQENDNYARDPAVDGEASEHRNEAQSRNTDGIENENRNYAHGSIIERGNGNRNDLRGFVLYSQEMDETGNCARLFSNYEESALSRRTEKKNWTERSNDVAPQPTINKSSFDQSPTTAVNITNEKRMSKQMQIQVEKNPVLDADDLIQRPASGKTRPKEQTTKPHVSALVSETPLVVVPEEPLMPETPAKTDKSTRISSIIRSSNFPATPMSVVKVSSARSTLPKTPLSIKRRRCEDSCREVLPRTPVSVNRSRSFTSPMLVEKLVRPSIHSVGTPRPSSHGKCSRKMTEYDTEHIKFMQNRFIKQMESSSRAQLNETTNRKNHSDSRDSTGDKLESRSLKDTHDACSDLERFDKHLLNESSTSKTANRSLQRIQRKERGQGDACSRSNRCPGCVYSAVSGSDFLDSRSFHHALETHPHTCSMHREMRAVEREFLSAMRASQAKKPRRLNELRKKVSKSQGDSTSETRAEDVYEFQSDSPGPSYKKLSPVENSTIVNETTLSEPSPARKARSKPSITSPYQRRKRVEYSQQEVTNLLHGVEHQGKFWTDILNTYQFHPSRTAVDLKDKYKSMMRAQRNSDTSSIASSSSPSRMSSVSPTHSSVSTRTRAQLKPAPFSMAESRRLRRGVRVYGCNWKVILRTENFRHERTVTELKRQWMKMCKNGENS